MHLTQRLKLRKAEMELEKGENIIEHEAEIYSRPRRTWFQSQKEKLKAKGAPNSLAFDALFDPFVEAISKSQYETSFPGSGKKEDPRMDDNKVRSASIYTRPHSKMPSVA